MSINLGIVLGISILPASGCNGSNKSKVKEVTITTETLDQAADKTIPYGFYLHNYGKEGTKCQTAGDLKSCEQIFLFANVVIDLDKIKNVAFVGKSFFGDTTYRAIASSCGIEELSLAKCKDNDSQSGPKILHFAQLPKITIESDFWGEREFVHLRVEGKDGRITNITLIIEAKEKG